MIGKTRCCHCKRETWCDLDAHQCYECRGNPYRREQPGEKPPPPPSDAEPLSIFGDEP